MLDKVTKLFNDMEDIEYVEFTRLLSPLEVVVTKRGSCHDQVMLEMEELQEICLRPKAKFIMAVDKDGQGLETHSFVYFKEDNICYWFENAWKDRRGIYQFGTEKELIKTVMHDFAIRLGRHEDSNPKLYIAEFNPDEHTIGEDLATLVSNCMANAKEYKLD
jgi:hypothetical protein